MKQFDVYGLGHALVDIEYSIDPDVLDAFAIKKGVMTLVDEAQQAAMISQLASRTVSQGSGGSAANTIIAVSQLGGRAFYSCCVAPDAQGRFYVADLSRAGVSTNADALMVPAGATGTCLVLVTPDAERTMCTFLGVSATVAPSAVDTAMLAASRYVYLEGYLATGADSLQAALYARDQARAAGTSVAVTLSDPTVVAHCRPAIDQLLVGGVDLLFANEEEAKALAGTDDLARAADRLRGWARQFVITRGPAGALAFDGQTMHTIPAVSTRAIDAVGAGDIFAGAFLYGITHQMSFPRAGALAALAAARLVACHGPRLTSSDMQALLGQFTAGAHATGANP